jgi:hypothetical protein
MQKDIVARLNAVIVKAINAPEMRETLIKQGFEAQAGTPEQFGAFIRNELAQNAKLARFAGLKPIAWQLITQSSSFHASGMIQTTGLQCELRSWRLTRLWEGRRLEAEHTAPTAFLRSRDFRRLRMGGAMKRSNRVLASMLVPAFILAGIVAQPVFAQDKAKDSKAAAPKDAKKQEATNSQKVHHDDDKVRVTETTTKPGERGNNVVRGFRVTRYLQGGTQERTYADGKKEKIERKTGEVFAAGPDKQAYFVTNVGKTTIVTYTVNIKEAKK